MEIEHFYKKQYSNQQHKFIIGSIVYLKTDTSKSNPMVVTNYGGEGVSYNYVVSWVNGMRTLQMAGFPETALVK